MKLIQGCCYTVPGASLKVYVRKIKYVSERGYTKACIEFVRKHKWSVFLTIKNVKLMHNQISHWQRIKDE